MAKEIVAQEEIAERREIIRTLHARGVTTPARLLKQKVLKGYYTKYRNPIATMKQDIRAVRQENARVLGGIEGDEILGDYREGIAELIFTSWQEIENIIQTGKSLAVNRLIRTLRELYKDYARSLGVDVERLDPQQIINMIGDVEVKQRVQGYYLFETDKKSTE